MIYRSLMFTPGTQKDRLIKSLTSEADALIWDLEDAVHPDDKYHAQTMIKETLDQLEKKPEKPIFLRVNAFETPWFETDAKLASHEAVQGILLPKTENKRQVEETWNLMNKKGEIITLIETAVGVRELEHILTHDKISGVALGAIDLAVDLDITLTDSGLELLYTRSRMVTLAKAAGINGIFDTVFADIHNTDSLRIRAELAKQLGFTGQMTVHPKQLAVIHGVYSPTPSEIEWSQRVIQALENEGKGKGVFTLDGKMVDRPVIERAKQIDATARRCGLVS